LRKLTQILKVFNTSNFIVDSNKDGKRIDAANEELIEVRPTENLAKKISAVDGNISSTNFFTQIFVPFLFENNTVDSNIMNLLPSELVFYICSGNMEKLKYSGINFNRKILFLNPLANSAGYIFNKQTINARPCGKNNIISSADLIDHIHTEVTLRELSVLMGTTPGNTGQTLDLKIIAAGETIAISKDDDMKLLHKVLQKNIFKKISLEIKRNSDDSLIRNFNEIAVLDLPKPAAIIGLLVIPKSLLTVNITDHSQYAGLNNFIIHLPALKPTVELTLNTNNFDNSSKIFFNGIEINNPGIANHPTISNFKQVTGSISNVEVFIKNGQLVEVENASKKEFYPVNVLHAYNPSTNKTGIIITKQTL